MVLVEECAGVVIVWSVDAEPLAGTMAPLAKIGVPGKLLASTRAGRAYRVRVCAKLSLGVVGAPV